MKTEGAVLPLALFWTLQAACVLTLALLLWLAQMIRRWPGGPSWLPTPGEGSRMVRVLARVLLTLAMSTVFAQILLLAGVQLGQLSMLSFDAFTLANLELAGLLLACLLHLVLCCVWPLHRRTTPTVRPPTPLSSAPTRREDRRWTH